MLEKITLKEALEKVGCTYEDIVNIPKREDIELPSVDSTVIQQLQNIAKEISQMNIAPNIKNALLAEIQAATSSELLTIQTTQIAYKEFAEIVMSKLHILPENIELFDETYSCTDKTTMLKILKDSRSRYLKYFNDVFDCDNYAEYNATYAAVNFKLNSVGQVDVALLAISGFNIQVLGLHACNGPVFSDKTITLYEGELGEYVPGNVLQLSKNGKSINILYIPLRAMYY